MARTNLHEQATRLLENLHRSAQDGTFEGALRAVAAEAGLNSARSAEAIKLLEELERIEVVQRGRRERKTIIRINSTDPVSREDAESRLPGKGPRRANTRLDYNDIGQAVVERLITLGRDDALRTAQVDAFAREAEQGRARIQELEEELARAQSRETELRVKLRTSEEALERAEENLRRAFGSSGPQRIGSSPAPSEAPDDETRAVLDILRSGT